MSEWLRAFPELLLILAVLGIPGLVLAVCLRFRPWDAIGLSVPLSLGVLAFANEASSHLHRNWGLSVIACATVVMAVACLGCSMIFARRGSYGTSVGHVITDRFEGVAWTVMQHRVAIGMTLVAVAAGAYAIARGIGTPQTLNQTYDGAFHVNSIGFVAQHHLASSAVVTSVNNPVGGGFYPPTFAALGSLAVTVGHVSPITAANVTAVAMACVWPLTMSIVIRRLARTSVFGYSVAMVGCVTVGLFPALLLTFGTLWPNTLSLLMLGPALVVLVRLLGLDQNKEGVGDPAGRLAWWPCLIAVVISLPGMALAHPGVLFMTFYLAVPLVIWAGWHRFVNFAERGWPPLLKLVAVVVVVVVIFVGVVTMAYHIQSIAVVRQQYWQPYESWGQGVGQILSLGTFVVGPNAAFAVLVLVGMSVAVRLPRGRFLISGYAIVAALTVATVSIQSHNSTWWTGFWYNDSYRLFAVLPVFVLPLAALGADWIHAALQPHLHALAVRIRIKVPTRHLTAGAVAGVVVLVGIVVLQKGLGTSRISQGISGSYAAASTKLVSDGQEGMFRRLASEVPAGASIAGDPYTGEVLAGVLSGHTVIYPAFAKPIDNARSLVALHFDNYATDPAVCAAVKSLKIMVVVTSVHMLPAPEQRQAFFAGFHNMAMITGLTQIDSGGGATAYRVGDCRS